MATKKFHKWRNWSKVTELLSRTRNLLSLRWMLFQAINDYTNNWKLFKTALKCVKPHKVTHKTNILYLLVKNHLNTKIFLKKKKMYLFKSDSTTNLLFLILSDPKFETLSFQTFNPLWLCVFKIRTTKHHPLPSLQKYQSSTMSVNNGFQFYFYFSFSIVRKSSLIYKSKNILRISEQLFSFYSWKVQQKPIRHLWKLFKTRDNYYTSYSQGKENIHQS